MRLNSGRDGIRSSLLLTDKDLKTDAFADCLNSLLGSGQVPGMLDAESLGLLLKDLQPAADAARVSMPPDAMLEFFLGRVRENLRVLLCVSPIGSTMRDYCRYRTVTARSQPKLTNPCMQLALAVHPSA